MAPRLRTVVVRNLLCGVASACATRFTDFQHYFSYPLHDNKQAHDGAVLPKDRRYNKGNSGRFRNRFLRRLESQTFAGATSQFANTAGKSGKRTTHCGSASIVLVKSCKSSPMIVEGGARQKQSNLEAIALAINKSGASHSDHFTHSMALEVGTVRRSEKCERRRGEVAGKKAHISPS